MHDLANYGLDVFGQPTPDEPRTFVVVGVPRGGTSMMAGSLHYLGVPMGDLVTEFTYEDLPLSRAIEEADLDRARSIIARRNRQHDVWGWKRPSSFKHLAVIDAEFRNPHYLVVFRDLFAIANRHGVSMGGDVLQYMKGTNAAYGGIVDFIAGSHRPFLLASYEKCVARPDVAVASIAKFVGLDATEAAERHIRPEPEDYLLTSHRRRTPEEAG